MSSLRKAENSFRDAARRSLRVIALILIAAAIAIFSTGSLTDPDSYGLIAATSRVVVLFAAISLVSRLAADWMARKSLDERL